MKTIVGLFARQLGLRLLKDIIDNKEYELKAVVTHYYEPDMITPRKLFPHFVTMCEDYNIPLIIVGKNQENLRILKELKFDYLIANCYKYIMPNEYLGMAKIGSYNMHRSLLPKHPGLKPLLKALKSGDEYVGTTMHELSEVVDGGKLIIQEKVPIEKGDTEASLFKKIYPQQYRIMKKGLEIINENIHNS